MRIYYPKLEWDYICTKEWWEIVDWLFGNIFKNQPRCRRHFWHMIHLLSLGCYTIDMITKDDYILYRSWKSKYEWWKIDNDPRTHWAFLSPKALAKRMEKEAK